VTRRSITLYAPLMHALRGPVNPYTEPLLLFQIID